MFPIPAPIIVSTSASVNHRRFFKPLIYLGATASLCYFFLFAFIINKDNVHRHRSRNSPLFSEKFKEDRTRFTSSEHSEKYIESGGPVSQQNIKNYTSSSEQQSHSELNQFYHIATKRRRREEKKQLALSSTSSSTSPPQPFQKRKTLVSLARKTKEKRSKQNGTRRSNPTKVWSGHQDLNQLIEKKQRRGHNGSKLSTEVYSHPWIKDEQCKTFIVQFAKKATFKPRALVSFPGSGNSWLRYLIECASGYFTGSVYDDKEIFTAGLLGEVRPPNDGSTIVQKTHHDTIYRMSSRQRKAYIKLSELMFGYRGLLLIRNPYDALVSYWNYIHMRDHKGTARRSQFDDIRWAKFVTEEIPRWTSLIISWIENSEDYLIIFYEEVQKNPRAELLRILEYLDQRVDKKRLDCLMKPKNLVGPFQRVHPRTTNTSDIPLSVDLIPVTITSQQDQNIRVEHQKAESDHNHHQYDQQTLLLLDSKKHQQQHPQSPLGEVEEQREHKFLSSLSKNIISSNSSQQQQQNQYTKMTSSSSPPRNDNENHQNHQHHHQYHHHNDSNNHLNNSSILRLDLIIQDNIDKINRFFQQKGIPAQLHYSPRPTTKPFFLYTVQSHNV